MNKQIFETIETTIWAVAIVCLINMLLQLADKYIQTQSFLKTQELMITSQSSCSTFFINDYRTGLNCHTEK